MLAPKHFLEGTYLGVGFLRGVGGGEGGGRDENLRHNHMLVTINILCYKRKNLGPG